MLIAAILLFLIVPQGTGGKKLEKDIIKTPSGDISISFIGHGSLMFEFRGKAIYVDPWSKLTDYTRLPKADIILITHDHPDHLDPKAVETLTADGTRIICNGPVSEVLGKGTVLKNGDTLTLGGIRVEAVPAYNTTAGRDQYHPRGRDNGYVLTTGGKRIYIAGDTESIPEMASLRNVDIAFLPMNQPYTMTPEQVASAVDRIHPHIVYPYHYGESDVSKLVRLLSKNKGIEVRVRSMK